MNGLNKLSNIPKAAQGNRGSITLSIAGPNIPNITGASIEGYKTNTSTGASYNITGTLAVSDGPNREFTWTFSEVDTGTAGIWRVYFILTIGGVPYRTLPASWEVVNSPDFVTVPGDPVVLVGVSPDEASWLAAVYAGFLAADSGDGLVKSGSVPAWVAGAGGGIPPVDPATVGNFVRQLADGTLEDATVSASSFDASGAAAVVQGNLETHTDLTTGAHGGILPEDAGIVAVSSTRNLLATDAGKILECDGTFTLTAPDGLDAGFQCAIVNVGAGTITLAATTTLQGKGEFLAEQYGAATIYHRGSNVWLAFGDLS